LLEHYLFCASRVAGSDRCKRWDANDPRAQESCNIMHPTDICMSTKIYQYHHPKTIELHATCVATNEDWWKRRVRNEWNIEMNGIDREQIND